MDAPSALLVQYAQGLAPGRALDLACGSGRNTFWLRENGWKVTAVDKVETSLGAIQADLEAGEFVIEENAWDLILMSHYLQRNLFEPVKRGLCTGGLAIVIVHLFEPGHETSRFSLSSGELARYFDGWEVLHYREGPSARGRAAAEIVARKPSP